MGEVSRGAAGSFRGIRPRAFRLRMGWALAAVALCTAVAVFAPGPAAHLRSAERFHDFLHVPGFALVAALFLWGFPEPTGASRGRRVRRLLAALVAAVAAGVLVEVLQAARGGIADLGDVVRDLGGAAAAVLAAASLWRDLGRRNGWILRAAAVAVGVGFLTPTLAGLADEARARREFPVFVDFRRPSELERLGWSPGVRASLTGGPPPALRLSLPPGEYPGFRLEYFPRDWRGWSAFVLRLENPEATPMELTVRIDDQWHDEDYHDRFNRTFRVAPGPNEVHIPLAEVEAAPRGRRLDLARVRSVVVFAHRLTRVRELVVRSLGLSP